MCQENFDIPSFIRKILISALDTIVSTELSMDQLQRNLCDTLRDKIEIFACPG